MSRFNDLVVEAIEDGRHTPADIAEHVWPQRADGPLLIVESLERLARSVPPLVETADGGATWQLATEGSP